MPMLTDGELARMRGTQQAAMLDTCRVLAYTATPDAWGQTQPTYTPGAAIACGYLDKSGLAQQEVRLDDKTLVQVAATVRLPLGTAIGARDRIEITHRQGQALSPTLTLEVVGSVRSGPTGIQLDLARVAL